MPGQIIQLPYNGLQTKIDPKVAPIGTYEVLDNVQQYRTPELIKRDAIPAIAQSSTPSNITAMYAYNNENGVLTTSGLYAYEPSLDRFIQKGYTASPIVTSYPVIANTYTQTCCDGATTASGIFGSIWEDSRGGVRCTIKDIQSDVILVPDLQLSSTGTKPKVVASNNYLVFVWIESSTTSVVLQQYNIIAGTWSSISTVTTSLDLTGSTFDILSINNAVVIAVVTTHSDPNAVIAYYWVPGLVAFGTGSNGYPAPAALTITAAAKASCLNLCTDPFSAFIYCSIVNYSNNDVYMASFNVSFNVINSGIKITSSGFAHPGYTISGCVDNNLNFYAYVTTNDGSGNYITYNGLVANANTTSPTVTTSMTPFYYQLMVCSRAVYFNSHVYLLLTYSSPTGLQNTYFGVREDGGIWARIFSTLGGGIVAKANCISSISFLSSTISGNSSTYISPLLKTTRISVGASGNFTTTSVFTVKLFFQPSNIDNKQIAKYLNIAGGYLKQYDGYSIFEQGYHLYPEQPTLTGTNVSGGGLSSTGVYSYSICWEWIDNLGQLQRSTPSIPTTITMSGSNNAVTITIPSLPITNKRTRFNDARTPVMMIVYRTLTTGTTYYKVNVGTNFTFNNDMAATITFTDGIADSTISSNTLLYTTGNVNPNFVVPASNLLAVAKNRVVIAGIDTEPNMIIYSKEKVEGIGVEFAQTNSSIIDSLGGDITALAAMDDKILIFKKSVIYYISGQGPDNTGNGSFTTPMLVSADCGCNAPQSIVLMKDGIMFESQKGIYLCDRSLNVTYIGSPVDHLTTNVLGFSITSAVNLPDRNQVYFTTNTNKALVYDTYFNNWYTHTFKFNPIGSTLSSNPTTTSINSIWYIASSNFVGAANQNVFYDNVGDSINTTIRTNWININSIGGFGRIYTVMILGDNALMDSTLVCNLYYDYEANPRQTVSINPTKLTSSTWGSDTTWGSGSPWGSTYYNGTYCFMVFPQMQKCTSIKIELIDSFSDGSRNSSFKFSGLALCVDVKSSWNKNIPYTRRLT